MFSLHRAVEQLVVLFGDSYAKCFEGEKSRPEHRLVMKRYYTCSGAFFVNYLPDRVYQEWPLPFEYASPQHHFDIL